MPSQSLSLPSEHALHSLHDTLQVVEPDHEDPTCDDLTISPTDVEVVHVLVHTYDLSVGDIQKQPVSTGYVVPGKVIFALEETENTIDHWYFLTLAASEDASISATSTLKVSSDQPTLTPSYPSVNDGSSLFATNETFAGISIRKRS